MSLTVGIQVVDFRVERFPHLPCRARKIDHHSVGIDQVHGESVRLEPPLDRIDVLLRYPKVLPKLFWREPFVEVRGRGILDVIEESLKRILVLRRSTQLKE